MNNALSDSYNNNECIQDWSGAWSKVVAGGYLYVFMARIIFSASVGLQRILNHLPICIGPQAKRVMMATFLMKLRSIIDTSIIYRRNMMEAI